jgi:Domain of unknown function (DUF4342)
MPTLTDRIVETFKLDRENVDDVIVSIKKLVHEGTVRRITIKSSDGATFAEFPLGVGVVVAALVPVWAVIGTIAAMAADYTIQVEVTEDTR